MHIVLSGFVKGVIITQINAQPFIHVPLLFWYS